MILDQLSTLLNMKQREVRKKQRFLSYKRKMSKDVRKSMFTRIANIFTLIERNGWKVDTIVLNGIQTLFGKLESTTKVGFEI